MAAGRPLRSNGTAWAEASAATPGIRTSGPGGIISLPLQLLSSDGIQPVSDKPSPLPSHGQYSSVTKTGEAAMSDPDAKGAGRQIMMERTEI
jgi:hypothetical protein